MTNYNALAIRQRLADDQDSDGKNTRSNVCPTNKEELMNAEQQGTRNFMRVLKTMHGPGRVINTHA